MLHDQPALAKAKAAERTQGELQEYLQTHFSRNTLAWGPVAVSRMRSYQGPSRQPQASLQAERARQTLGQRNKSQIVRASFHDDCAHVFGEKGHIGEQHPLVLYFLSGFSPQCATLPLGHLAKLTLIFCSQREYPPAQSAQQSVPG